MKKRSKHRVEKFQSRSAEDYQSKKRYHIKSKSRFTLFMVCVLIMMIFTTSTVLGANTTDSLTKPNYTQIVVTQGDTLWQIASEFGPDDQDTRKIVRAVCDVNDIASNAVLQPGQVLLIPVYL